MLRLSRLLLLCLVLAGLACQPGDEAAPWLSTGLPEAAPNRTSTITICAVGDIMAHGAQLDAAYNAGTKTYCFRSCFTHVAPVLKSADITIGNLETTLAGKDKGYTGYPAFNTPETLADALQEAGFDLLTTANNHCLDRQEYGLRRTLDQLDARGLLHVGTARTQEERDTPVIVERKGIKVAFLAYTYGTNGIPVPKPFMVNPLHPQLMIRDIQAARAAGADIVVVCLHFGVEYQRQPNKDQRDLVRLLLAQDVDIIFGGHPHVVQPIEVVRAGDGHPQVVAYSLGNFISAQQGPYKDAGVMVQVQVTKDALLGTAWVSGVDYTPTWVQRSRGFRVLNVPQAIAEYDQGKAIGIGASDYRQLNQVWKDTTTHLGDVSLQVVLPDK